MRSVQGVVPLGDCHRFPEHLSEPPGQAILSPLFRRDTEARDGEAPPGHCVWSRVSLSEGHILVVKGLHEGVGDRAVVLEERG